ncbi:MAG: anti-sigma factor [Rhodocyclaceae bacterium]|nr:anti-sigma factor [Rhodocyclaceae bacterium]
MTRHDPKLLDELAARHALGLQSARVRRRVGRLAARDATLSAAIARWEDIAARMSETTPPISPPARVWSAVENRLTPAPAARQKRPGWFDWLRPALGFALVMVLAAGLVQMIGPRQPVPGVEQALPASYVGILADRDGRARLLVSSQRHGRTAHIKWLVPPTLPAGTRAELWALPAEGEPFLLGVLPGEGPATVTLADTSEALLSRVARLGVAFRPADGDTSTPPTEFELIGHCAKLW